MKILISLLVDWCKINSHELLARGGDYFQFLLGFNPFQLNTRLRNVAYMDNSGVENEIDTLF